MTEIDRQKWLPCPSCGSTMLVVEFGLELDPQYMTCDCRPPAAAVLRDLFEATDDGYPSGFDIHTPYSDGGEEDDDESDVEDLVAELQAKGDVVFAHNWEGGAGEYGSYVYKMDGQYYAYDMYDDSVVGPFSTLKDALSDEFVNVSSATTSIRSSELGFEELVTLLKMKGALKESITINGTAWNGG